jgi:hypothetical protein
MTSTQPSLRPARVAITGVMGPYQAVVPDITHDDPAAYARFTRAEVLRMIVDCEDLITHEGPDNTTKMRMRSDGAVELLQWDDDTGWRAFETCTPDADGLYQFDPRSFLWWEVDPGGGPPRRVPARAGAVHRPVQLVPHQPTFALSRSGRSVG